MTMHSQAAAGSNERLSGVPVGRRVDWWCILNDLNQAGLSLSEIASGTAIPRPTIVEFKNLNIEPMNSDASALLGLWREWYAGDVPVKGNSVRNAGL